MKSFTNQSIKDLPEGMTPEQATIAYAAWGKFIELSASFIPWDSFMDYTPVTQEVIGTNEDGLMIMEATIKVRFTAEVQNEEAMR